MSLMLIIPWTGTLLSDNTPLVGSCYKAKQQKLLAHKQLSQTKDQDCAPAAFPF